MFSGRIVLYFPCFFQDNVFKDKLISRITLFAFSFLYSNDLLLFLTAIV